MIELQTSIKTSKQDNTTGTRTPKPGYLKLTIISLSRCCEGDSLISSLSRDMLSTNKTLEKCDFDY
jgi:hypothetical protein